MKDITNWQQNEDGVTWSEAVPLPFYGLKKKCHCGKSFWDERNYQVHYRRMHTDGIRYIRLRNGKMQPVGEHAHQFTTAGDSTDASCDTCDILQSESWKLL